MLSILFYASAIGIVLSAIALCVELRKLKKVDKVNSTACGALNGFVQDKFKELKEEKEVQMAINKALNDKIARLYSQNLQIEDQLIQLKLSKVTKKVAKKKVAKKVAKKKVTKKKVAKKKATKKVTKK